MSRDLDYGLSRMYQTYCEMAGFPIEIFHDEPSANAWLAIDGVGSEARRPRAG